MLKKTSNLEQMMVNDGMGLLLNYEKMRNANLSEGSDGGLQAVFLEQNKTLFWGKHKIKKKIKTCFD